jgi:glycosyltransferase involved in cell wall biosynthesis
VVDDTDRVARQGELSVFRESRSSFTLVSLADAPLEAALKADPFLLEKVAHTLHQHAPAVVWLVTTEPDAAWPGFLLSEEQARSAPVRCVGFCLSLGTLFHARPSDIPEVSDSFVEDVARHMHELAPHSSLTLVVGPHLTPHEGVALPRAGRAHEAPAPVDPAPAPPPRAPSPRVQLFRLGAFLIGKGMNRLARGALSPQNHERVVQSYLVRGMRARLKGEPPPPRSRHPAAMRPGPLPPSAWKDSRDRSVHAFVLGQPPRFGDALAAEAPALMVVASSLGPGPEGRALRQLLQELAALAPQQRVYLVLAPDKAQRPTLALAREYLAHVAGVFDLPAMARNPGEALAALAERLGVTSVLISDNQTAFEALPALRRLSRRLRIVAHAHRLRVEADPEKSSPCAFVASRFNNLLDGYALTFEDAADTLVKELYVSASKVRVLPLTPESRLAPARRPLLEAGRPAQVVWVQPAAASDERLLLLLDIVRLWRRRHVGQGITFQVAFQGAVASWMPPALRQFKMEDMVSLVANAADPQPLYRDADCLVLPGVTRDATLIAVEAMAAGVPVVAMPEELGASKEWEARLAFALEHPERPLDYVRALELLTDGPEQARARAAQLREALTAQEPRAAALRQLVEWLLPPPPPAWVPQRAAS